MLKTEMRNPKTTHIDRMSSEQIVRVIQDENKYAVQAIDTELAAISAAVDAIVRRMKEGGRLFYVGCGTSGRVTAWWASRPQAVPPMSSARSVWRRSAEH